MVIGFPPEGFTFFRGVNPLFRMSLEERGELAKVAGPAPDYSISMTLETPALPTPIQMEFGKIFLATIDDGTLPDGVTPGPYLYVYIYICIYIHIYILYIYI